MENLFYHETIDKTTDIMETVLFTTVSASDIGKMTVRDYYNVAVIASPYANASPKFKEEDKKRVRQYLNKAVMLN